MEIVGGEQYILSAVMHADERNRAMSDALGQDVYHYHLHVVYVPVVEKEIALDETMQRPRFDRNGQGANHASQHEQEMGLKPVIGEDGKPLKTKTGKAVLKQSYSILQDDFFEYMRSSRIHRCVGTWRAWQL